MGPRADVTTNGQRTLFYFLIRGAKNRFFTGFSREPKFFNSRPSAINSFDRLLVIHQSTRPDGHFLDHARSRPCEGHPTAFCALSIISSSLSLLPTCSHTFAFFISSSHFVKANVGNKARTLGGINSQKVDENLAQLTGGTFFYSNYCSIRLAY